MRFIALIILLSTMVYGSVVVISPNMGMPVPVVGQDPSPDWANDINASLSIIDSHNHTTGQGVAITPDGLDINADLPMNENNLTETRTISFEAQSTPIPASGSDLGVIYESGVDLYYNDGAGNQVRITQGGTVSGSAGTITGLPSGTASASYSAGTFTFQSATLTPASMNFGPITIGNQVASAKTITIAPNSGIPNNYNLTLPAALPAALNYTTLDASGNLSYNSSGTTGTGAVVLATSPTITTPTLTSPTISGTVTFSGIASLANGSAAAPSLNFTNSTTTGIYRSGADVIGFSSSGTNSGSINSTGNWSVGLISATPQTVHDIYGGINLQNTNDFFMGHNGYIGANNARNLNRYDTSKSSAVLDFSSSASSSGNALAILSNLPGDGATTGASTSMTMSGAGTFSFGKAAGVTTHSFNGSVSATGAIAATTTVTAPAGVVFASSSMDDFNEGTWSPTFTGFTGTITNVTLNGVGRFHRVGNTIVCQISVDATASGAGSGTFTTTLPILPNNNFANATQLIGSIVGLVSGGYPEANTGAKTALTTLRSESGATLQYTMQFTYIKNN